MSVVHGCKTWRPTRVKFKDLPTPLRGAMASDWCDCHKMACEAFPKRRRDSGLTLAAYMLARFGRPEPSGDRYKYSMGMWVLATKRPDVFLCVMPSASGIEYSFSYYITDELSRAIESPRTVFAEKRLALCERLGIGYWDAVPNKHHETFKGELGHLPMFDAELANAVNAALAGAIRDLAERRASCRDVEFSPMGVFN